MKTHQDFVSFLEKFNLTQEVIDELTQGKKLFRTMQGNVFLNSVREKGKNIYGEGLMFVQLENLLPSKFLLKYAFDKSPNVLEIQTEKQALNFVYGKDLSLGVVNNSTNLDNEKFYFVEFEGNVLGYVSYHQGGNFELKNEMNIGEYLKET